jgi:hypothetical protein
VAPSVKIFLCLDIEQYFYLLGWAPTIIDIQDMDKKQLRGSVLRFKSKIGPILPCLVHLPHIIQKNPLIFLLDIEIHVLWARSETIAYAVLDEHMSELK